jgi:aminoglycoside adenylyltransferase-like protein/nucleotidyltransferase-like protein
VIPDEIRPQLARLAAGIGDIVGEDIVGVYVHGSAVLGSFGPWSDIDLVVVGRRAIELDERRRLVELLLSSSSSYEDTGPIRPVEMDFVTMRTLEHWRHPAQVELHYGESLRARLEAEGLEASGPLGNRDLAAHVVVLRDAGVALSGPSPRQLFPAIPDADYHDALLYDADWSRDHLPDLGGIPGGIRNAVLGLARLWATLATTGSYSKVTGAEWARPRLPECVRPVLDHALGIYCGHEREARWEELPYAEYVARVATEVDRLR